MREDDEDLDERECARCGHEAPEKYGSTTGDGWYCMVCTDWNEEQTGVK